MATPIFDDSLDAVARDEVENKYRAEHINALENINCTLIALVAAVDKLTAAVNTSQKQDVYISSTQ